MHTAPDILYCQKKLAASAVAIASTATVVATAAAHDQYQDDNPAAITATKQITHRAFPPFMPSTTYYGEISLLVTKRAWIYLLYLINLFLYYF